MVAVGGGGGVGGWRSYLYSFKIINVFHREPYGPPSRNNGVQLLLEGVRPFHHIYIN